MLWVVTTTLAVIVAFMVWHIKELEKQDIRRSYKKTCQRILEEKDQAYSKQLKQLNEKKEAIISIHSNSLKVVREHLDEEVNKRKALENAFVKLNEDLEEDNILQLKRERDDLVLQLSRKDKDIRILERVNEGLGWEAEQLEKEVGELKEEVRRLEEDKHEELRQREIRLFGEFKRVSHWFFRIVENVEDVKIPDNFFKAENSPLKVEEGYEYYNVDGEEIAIPVTVCDYLRETQPDLFGLSGKMKSKSNKFGEEGVW